MVYGVVGKLGGGKSLSCVYLMLKALNRGDRVTSNIKLKDDYLQKHRINASKYRYIDDFADVDPWTLPKGDLRGSGGRLRSMIVIDEAGEWLDSYSDARHKGQLSDVASWLRQSDKLGQDVFFIVQFENLLHTRLRSIVHRWLVCMDLQKLRIPVINFGLPWPLNSFVICTEFDGRSKEYNGRIWIPKSKQIFEAYDTAAFFGLSWASSSKSVEMEANGGNYERQVTYSFRSFIVFNAILWVILCVSAIFFIFLV